MAIAQCSGEGESNTKLLTDLAFGAGLAPVEVSISLSSHGRRGKKASSGLFLKEAIPCIRSLSAWPNQKESSRVLEVP